MNLTASLEMGRIRRAFTSLLIASVLAVSGFIYVNPASADLARTGSTVLVSAFPDGTPADGGEPSVSADGRYVVFASWDKLLPEARDNCQSVYRKDMVTGELLLLTPGTCSSYLRREHQAFTLLVGVVSVCPDQRTPRAFTSGHLEEERSYVMKGRGKRMCEDNPHAARDSSRSAGCSKCDGDEASARSIWIESDSCSAFAAVGGVPWPA